MSNKKSPMPNTYIYLTLLVSFVVFSLISYLHDPFLHTIIGTYVNHWQFDSYTTSIGTGSTNFLVTSSDVANTPTFNYWLFYMFPSMTVFILAFVLVFYNPNRLIIVGGLIAMALNFSSLLPNIPGSDAQKAVDVLISRGWSEPSAYGVALLITIIMFLIAGLYLYIAIENNPKDAKARAENIFH